MMKVQRDPHRTASMTPVPKSGVLSVRPQLSDTWVDGPTASCFEVRPNDPLLGGVDIDAAIAVVPDAHTIKGMFFSPLVADLGERFAESAPRLSAPPRRGAYLPFADYPVRDFLRLYDAAARRCHPSRSAREAYRRVARQQFDVFAQSALGRVTMNFANDPSAALQRYANSLATLIKGPTVRAWQTRQDTVGIDVTGYHGLLEYPLGMFEAIVMRFGATPTIVADAYAHDAVAFLIHW